MERPMNKERTGVRKVVDTEDTILNLSFLRGTSRVVAL